MSESNINSQLEELGGSNFKVAEGQPDIRDWKVKDARNQGLGHVKELIFDQGSQKVKYIVLDLDGNGMELQARTVLIPIGLAELHEQEDEVIFPDVSSVQLQELPVYDSTPITSDTESRIKEIFSGIGLGSSAQAGDNFLEKDYYNPDNLLKRRIKVTGTTVIGIFENGFEAQNSVNKLKLAGFSEEQLDICLKDSSEDEDDSSRFSQFFDSLLENKEQASHFTELAKKGTVVTVHAQTNNQAQHAASILDQHGSHNIQDNSDNSNASNTIGEKDQEAVKARLYSTIIGKSLSNEMRLRTRGQDSV